MLLKLNCYMLDSLGKLTRVYSRPASTQALQMLLPTGTAIFQLFEPELTGQETHKSVNHRYGFGLLAAASTRESLVAGQSHALVAMLDDT